LLRWVVPLGAAGVVGLVAGGALSAQAADKLEPRTAAQLLADLQTSHVNGFYGTVVQSAELGLPELPNIGGSSSTGSLADLLTGSHSARVWYAGPTKQRIAVMESVNETDVFRDGDQVWQWSSATKTATHTQLPAGSAKHEPPGPTLTPDQVAQRALAALDPTTIVQTDNSTTVAGRAAYELVLVPRAAGSRVGAVHIAIDGQYKVPLGVQVYPRGADPSKAIDVSFTDINFAVPGDDNFRFTPPKGATVREQPMAMGGAGLGEHAAAAALNPQVIGTGWTSIVALRASDLLPGMSPPPPGTAGTPGREPAPPGAAAMEQLLNALTPVSGTWGSGRLLDSKLLSVLVTDDGRIFAGAVDPSALYAAAATHK
jgi:outer membrane lipoprotein-sorting protein